MKKVALISHGCAKNLVDSELILGILAKNGYKITLNENESDIVRRSHRITIIWPCL